MTICAIFYGPDGNVRTATVTEGNDLAEFVESITPPVGTYYIVDDSIFPDYMYFNAWAISEDASGEPVVTIDPVKGAALEYEWAANEEVEWRARELAVIARQLEALEEAEVDETPPDLMPGTRKQWLSYRGKVSNWKEGVEPFPDRDQRPVRPA